MRNAAIILASFTLLAPALDAQRNRRGSAQEARNFRRLEVPGTEVQQNVGRLTKELRWHKSLKSALVAGRTSGKPVLWIQALGNLDGFL